MLARRRCTHSANIRRPPWPGPATKHDAACALLRAGLHPFVVKEERATAAMIDAGKAFKGGRPRMARGRPRGLAGADSGTRRGVQGARQCVACRIRTCALLLRFIFEDVGT